MTEKIDVYSMPRCSRGRLVTFQKNQMVNRHQIFRRRRSSKAHVLFKNLFLRKLHVIRPLFTARTVSKCQMKFKHNLGKLSLNYCYGIINLDVSYKIVRICSDKTEYSSYAKLNYDLLK